jgi:hypothetical protein
LHGYGIRGICLSFGNNQTFVEELLWQVWWE